MSKLAPGGQFPLLRQNRPVGRPRHSLKPLRDRKLKLMSIAAISVRKEYLAEGEDPVPQVFFSVIKEELNSRYRKLLYLLEKLGLNLEAGRRNSWRTRARYLAAALIEDGETLREVLRRIFTMVIVWQANLDDPPAQQRIKAARMLRALRKKCGHNQAQRRKKKTKK